MKQQPQIICAGSALWDIIGRTDVKMQVGSDFGGRITVNIGGVALNAAMKLAQIGHPPALLSAIGRDRQGNDLIAQIQDLGIDCSYIYRPQELPTDKYMAIEGANGLVAAVADAHSLEQAGWASFEPFVQQHGAYQGIAVIDGNFTTEVLERLAHSKAFAQSDMRIAPASPGKAARIAVFMQHAKATFYVNLEEAGTILNTTFTSPDDAAASLQQAGVYRAIITNGPRASVSHSPNGTCRALPPHVKQACRITGAGDTFMAAHIAAELSGANEQTALTAACNAAAEYVGSDGKNAN